MNHSARSHVGYHIVLGILFLTLGCSARVRAQLVAQDAAVIVVSPNDQVRIELAVIKQPADGASIPYWSVLYKGRPIILNSRLGVDLADGPPLGASCEIESTRKRAWHQQYSVSVGKRSNITDHGNETVVTLREEAEPHRKWELALRAYDDGVAFQYRFLPQESMKTLAVAAERTEFIFPKDAQATYLPFDNFTSSFEGRYGRKPVSDIPTDKVETLPMLVECPGAGWAGITEANLTDYAGMYLVNSAEHPGVLTSRLSPLPDDPKIAVRASLPHVSPWRVVLLGDTAGSLLESNLIFNLNEPSKIKDASWIHPGKTTFPWWNDYYLENVPFKPGQNTATHKYYIDFCAEAGIRYHSLDGYQNIGWYGCEIQPNHTPADITKAIPEIDLPELLRYAKSKGVKLRLWLHWADVKGQMDRAFPLYHQWGIEGVMLDFMNRDDQEMIAFLRTVLEKAAENHLTVSLHGMSKPTGLERTYPNLLTSEGVLNLEYDKWDKLGCPPTHQLTTIYTRMLAGPMDYHQGSFRGEPVDQFKPRNTAPIVMGTPTFMLATYVVFENHLPMVADYPSAYRGNPATPVLAEIPASWDETKFLAGEVAEYIVMARRHGDAWYIGAMNAGPARTVNVPLNFLGEKSYRAEICTDDPAWQTNHSVVTRSQSVTANQSLPLKLESAGGYVARLSPGKN